ncbi:MAG: metallophosphoesterase family protein [Longimicrobiales bacterium]
MKIGIISDTHGKLRRAVFTHFDGVEHILHAGDIGPLDLLAELEAIAPVTAVWGNTDDFSVRAAVPEIARTTLADRRITVVHGHQLGTPTPPGLLGAHPDADIIVYGHTHRPLIVELQGRRIVNPGGAGAARFGLSPSVILMTIEDGAVDAELIIL